MEQDEMELFADVIFKYSCIINATLEHEPELQLNISELEWQFRLKALEMKKKCENGANLFQPAHLAACIELYQRMDVDLALGGYEDAQAKLYRALEGTILAYFMDKTYPTMSLEKKMEKVGEVRMVTSRINEVVNLNVLRNAPVVRDLLGELAQSHHAAFKNLSEVPAFNKQRLEECLVKCQQVTKAIKGICDQLIESIPNKLPGQKKKGKLVEK